MIDLNRRDDRQEKPSTLADCIGKFQAVLTAEGYGSPEIEADGVLHRFSLPDDKGHKKTGWYVFYPDDSPCPAGSFGDWREQVSHSWSSKQRSEMTKEERKEHDRRMDMARQERDAKRKQEADKAAVEAVAVLAAAPGASDDHPYLKKKRVRSFGLKIGEHGNALVPFRDAAGNVRGFQRITTAGEKFFQSGAFVTGNFYLIPGDMSTVFVCEGYATGASIHMATGQAVVVAFNAGNLDAATASAKEAFSGSKFVIAADDDRWTTNRKGEPWNPGQVKASEAAAKHCLPMVTPAFKDLSKQPTDFNDLHTLEGLDAVRACIEARAAQVASIWDSPVDIAALLATQPEPMKWLVRDNRSDPPAPIIPFARGGVWTALGGTGKTALLKVMAAGCVTGHLPINEWSLERTGRVVLVLTEDTLEEFHEDLHRLCQGMTTREREAVTRDMIVYPLAGEDTRLLIKNERGVVEKSALYHALMAKIKAIGGVVLVGLDPALGITEGDEMSQTDQRALGRAVDDLAVNVCATCILLSHSGKAIAGAEELSSHSSRGGGALTDAVRFEFTMRGMTKKEASAHGIEDLEERLHLVQITCTKGNRVPPSAKVPVWLRFDRGVLVSAGLAEPEKKAKADGTKLPKSASLAFEAIKEATMEHGQIDDATGRPYVAMDDIRSTHKDLYSQRNPANGDRAERKALQDGTSKLVELGWIKSDGLTVTFSGPGMEAHVQNILTAMAERRGRNCGTERNFSEFCSAKGTETAEQTGTSPLYKGSSCSEKFRGDFDQGRKENSERVATKPPIHDTPDGPMTFSLDALTGEPLEVQP